MNREIALAYVGSVVPDTPGYENGAFSRAGNMFQENLLAGLANAGIVPSMILSARPVPAFPRCATLWQRSRTVVLGSGMRVRLLPFLNMSPVKQLMLGLGVLGRLLWWGWRHRDSGARIVYTFNLTVPSGLFTLAAARLVGARAIASVNDINEPGHTVPCSWRWRMDFALHRFLLPRFDALVVVSRAIIDDFAPQARCLRVEGGVTPAMAANAARSDAPKRDVFRVVLAGSLEAANGVDILLQAIPFLGESHYRFEFAGAGSLAGRVQRAAAMDPRIVFRGALKLDEVLSMYRQADLLVNMRLTQAIRTRYFFPSKLMEFLASGTAVLTTCAESVEREYGGFAFLLREETPEGLAAAIRSAEAAGAAARGDMGRRARAFLLEHKSWQAQAARVASLLRSLAWA